MQTSRAFRDPPEDMITVYDVFDADGVFVRRVNVPVDGDGQADGLIFARDDRLMLVKGFTDALVHSQA